MKKYLLTLLAMMTLSAQAQTWKMVFTEETLAAIAAVFSSRVIPVRSGPI